MLRPTATRRLLHAVIVLGASLSYLAYVFQVFDLPWNTGLGDWGDPYFINALLEHWYRSVTILSDPISPPMYFPARKTLAYSHGLVLFAPFYVPLRLLLHPFTAYTMALFAVIEAGMLCLYVLLRKLGLSFFEAIVLGALFLSSANVMNAEMGVWSQRASVFLIPPILLLLFGSARMRSGRPRLLVAGFAGLLATLLYVHDFYTAHFTFLFAALFTAAVLFVENAPRERILNYWRGLSRTSRLTLGATTLAAAWVYWVLILGGGELAVAGVRVRSHDWRRPALVALVMGAAFLYSSGLIRRGIRLPRRISWRIAVGLGAAFGVIVFLWVYLGAYQGHRRFPEEQLLSSLVVRDPGEWHGPLDAVRNLGAYDTHRSFVLVIVIALLAWLPWFNVERSMRFYVLWLLAVSVIVLFIPLRFPRFSLWRAVFERLPGFEAIRDPKRIIQLYELTAVLAIALFVRRLAPTSVLRFAIALLLAVPLVVNRHVTRFGYERPIPVYEHWVAKPIAIDPACRSFYIAGAPAEYMARSTGMWPLYNIDALFVALNTGIPTLNGYSAWFPEGWVLHNPHEPVYQDRVKRWIAENGLTGVCELDIAARTMTLRVP